MRLHRVVALLVCLIPVGGLAVWLEAYRFRLEQRIAELSDRLDQFHEVNARLRAQLAQQVSPAFIEAATQQTSQPPPSPQANTRAAAPADTAGPLSDGPRVGRSLVSEMLPPPDRP